MTPTMSHPDILTPRLRLRVPEARDTDAAVAFLGSDRSRFMGGPLPPGDAAAEFDMVRALWDRRGFSLFAIGRHEGDTAIGLAGAWQPEGFVEPEIGWNLWNAADEGQGLATEAVTAVRDWAFGALGLTTAVSYINVENHRSARLAERVGATPDPTAFSPYPPPILIYRHRRGAGA